MVARNKKVPPVASEQEQQAILNELKHFSIVAAAKQELIKETPELQQTQILSMFPEDINGVLALNNAIRLKISPDLIDKASKAGSADDSREEINNLKESKAAAIDELKLSKITHRIPSSSTPSAAEIPQVKNARTLTSEEKEAVTKEIEYYVRKLEIRDEVAYSAIKNPKISPEDREKAKEFLELSPNEIGLGSYKSKASNSARITELIEQDSDKTRLDRHPLSAFDRPTQLKNGLIETFDKITRQIRQEIKDGEHAEEINNMRGDLLATSTEGRILSDEKKQALAGKPKIYFTEPETKSSKILNPEEKEAIEKVKAFAKEYELRNATVAAVMKENPDLAKANSRIIDGYMAIPNPMDALDSRNPLAGELRKAYNEAIANTKKEIEEGGHDTTIKEMKKDLLKSFAPLQKSEMKGTDLPDHVKEETFKVALELRSQFKESGVNPNASTDVRVSKGITNKGGDLALA